MEKHRMILQPLLNGELVKLGINTGISTDKTLTPVNDL